LRQAYHRSAALPTQCVIKSVELRTLQLSKNVLHKARPKGALEIARKPFGMGSLSEFLLLARNLSKLPGGFRDRAQARLMTEDGWKSEWPLNAFVLGLAAGHVAWAAEPH
jgi:hypothetical protein